MHPVILRTGTRLGTEKQRGHPVGEPDRCQGPVRQLVVLDHCVTGRKDLVHHDGPLHGHGRKWALVLLSVNPFYGHRLEPIGVKHEHFLSRLDLARENRRHPLPFRAVAADEEEMRSGEGDFMAWVGFDDVEEPPGRGVLVYEHDEVGVNRLSIVICCQDPVSFTEIFDRLLGAILQSDRGGSWEAAAWLCSHWVFCQNKDYDFKIKSSLLHFYHLKFLQHNRITDDSFF